jgi:hypothetical protein
VNEVKNRSEYKESKNIKKNEKKILVMEEIVKKEEEKLNR